MQAFQTVDLLPVDFRPRARPFLVVRNHVGLQQVVCETVAKRVTTTDSFFTFNSVTSTLGSGNSDLNLLTPAAHTTVMDDDG